MRFAMLAPCHEAGSLTPVHAAFDPSEVEIVVLPSRRDDGVPCDSATVPASLTDDMLDELAWQGPWDGVLVVLGGMPVANGQLSDAKHLSQRVRRILGPDVPVGTVDDARQDIATQLSEGLNVLWLLRTIAVDPTAGPAGS